MRLTVKGRLRELLELAAAVFDQPEASVATPMGVDNKTCHTIVTVSQRLLCSDEAELSAEEAEALLCAMQLVRRNLMAEFNLQMQELQKAMAAIATAQTTIEILKQCKSLPAEAEKAVRSLESVVKARGTLLNEVTALIKKLKASRAH